MSSHNKYTTKQTSSLGELWQAAAATAASVGLVLSCLEISQGGKETDPMG